MSNLAPLGSAFLINHSSSTQLQFAYSQIPKHLLFIAVKLYDLYVRHPQVRLSSTATTTNTIKSLDLLLADFGFGQ